MKIGNMELGFIQMYAEVTDLLLINSEVGAIFLYFRHVIHGQILGLLYA